MQVSLGNAEHQHAIGRREHHLVVTRAVTEREVAGLEQRFAPILAVDALALELRVRATWAREWRTICASEYTSASVMSPTCVGAIEPLKLRRSAGSDTSGEKLSVARSFQ